MDKKVKLLVCYHKKDILFKNEIFTPIHVGRSLAKKRMGEDNPVYQWLNENMFGDDTGENISDQNSSYNEMTAVYWAWKNYDQLGDPDFVGLMHYRRHFAFKKAVGESHYPIYTVDDSYYDTINFSEEKVQKLLEGADFAYHHGFVGSVKRHFLEAHREKDLEVLLDILKRRSPEYYKNAKRFLRQDGGCFCNMFIFPKDIFFDYCNWIFPILEEFVETVKIGDRRLFVSERLTGLFVYTLLKNKKVGVPLPISFIEDKRTLPVVMPISEDEKFYTYASLNSLLANSNRDIIQNVTLLSTEPISDETKNVFEKLKIDNNNLVLNFVDASEVAQKHNLKGKVQPLILAESLKLGKCLYIDNKTLISGCLYDFFFTSVDDYFVYGIKNQHSILVCNLNRMRNANFVENCVSCYMSENDIDVALFKTLDYMGELNPARNDHSLALAKKKNSFKPFWHLVISFKDFKPEETNLFLIWYEYLLTFSQKELIENTSFDLVIKQLSTKPKMAKSFLSLEKVQNKLIKRKKVRRIGGLIVHNPTYIKRTIKLVKEIGFKNTLKKVKSFLGRDF